MIVPLPVRYRIHFGAPMRFGGPLAPTTVAHNVGLVRGSLQELIERALAERAHVFF